jgi:hypothetical protein
VTAGEGSVMPEEEEDAFDVFVDWHVIAPFYFSFDPQQQR